MTTAARTFTSNEAQFYLPSGEPFYQVPYADPKKGMRRATLADARKVGALPGPTTILKVLAKPELQNWITEQSILASLTTAPKPEECGPKCPTCNHAQLKDVDAFIHRVLHVEKVQDQERDTAADFGKRIHEACANYFLGIDVDPEMRPWIDPALKALTEHGQLVTAEKVLIGDGYGGRCDLILENDEHFVIVDYKATKTLPEKGAYPEHKLQLSAYAAAFNKLLLKMANPDKPPKPIRCANCYISSVNQGQFAIWLHQESWTTTFLSGFEPVLKAWSWINNYYPEAK